ncbi:MICOS complex subunit MIC19 isoform X3 [Anolis carolinensis]|uniref:MICOS complex subunit MIC19 isoform X3 n=1 Tax=Anolis carolinensis TaxID=28377 RepID=UPI0004625AAE|nr:PREDICTED: MICOS complex subunit MIC19 isoform X3 [Anolis carolinensis]|eukprot:XP_008108487.1 PREDICTED: MICOS complex subunit MIC19 isoform X3 [Anolis carolinensis]
MGGGGSAPRRVTFEADENENITVVKGVRLSENVIERMKEPSSPGGRSQQKAGSSGRGSVGGTSVNEEDLKKRIAEELALEQARRDAEAHKRLKQDQMHVRDEIGKVLERERTASNEQLARAILRERAATEEERVKAQLLSAQFYKVTTEQYQKAVDEVEAKFKRYKSTPVCADLQSKIFQCYQENSQQTLSCSALASEYFKCVNHAKQSMAGRGG